MVVVLVQRCEMWHFLFIVWSAFALVEVCEHILVQVSCAYCLSGVYLSVSVMFLTTCC